MKKYYPFFILLVFISSIELAQAQLGVGLKAGVNIANQKGTDLDYEIDLKSLAGFHAGGYVNYFLSDPVAVQVEILFSQKGSKWDDSFDSAKDILSYFDIPLLIRYQILEFLNVHAGPQFGFLTSAKTKYDDGYEEDAKDWYKSTDVGLVLGAEGNFPFKINVTIRYIVGLSNIATEELGNTWKNNVFQISVGYRLIGK